MTEKIYRRLDDGALVEIAERDPARRYRYRLVEGTPAYIEFTDSEEHSRNEHERARAHRPPEPPSIEERVRAIEARLDALEGK